MVSSSSLCTKRRDAVWLLGDRQAAVARRLGLSQAAILRSLYPCDQAAFEGPYLARIAEGRPLERSFLYAGKFSPEKGLIRLCERITLSQIYRKTVPNAWPLVCCGAGPLSSSLVGKAGIRIEGFVQPQRLPDVFASAGCLILPSRFEPWGVVVHEAALAGMLILASKEVGSTPHLVQPGYNGFIFSKGDTTGLAEMMSRVSARSDACLDEMSRASFLLSRQYSPKRWADTLLSSFRALPGNQETAEHSAALTL